MVWDPSIDLRHRSRPAALGDTELSFKAHGFIYTDNPIFNHGNYRVQLRQALDRDTTVMVRYRYVPNLFLGPNDERRTGLRLPEEERVTSHIWRLQVERRLIESVMATLVGRYGLRQYNEAFAERDTTFWTVGPEFGWAIRSWLSVTVAYLYERGVADGRQETQFKDDISYHQHFASLGVTMWLQPALSATVGYAYRQKLFSSDIVGDTNKGVTDSTHLGSAEVHYQLTPVSVVTVEVQRSQRSSNTATRDFFNTNISLGMQYRF